MKAAAAGLLALCLATTGCRVDPNTDRPDPRPPEPTFERLLQRYQARRARAPQGTKRPEKVQMKGTRDVVPSFRLPRQRGENEVGGAVKTPAGCAAESPRLRALLPVVALGVVVAGACRADGPAGPPRPANVLLITVDTLRPDALGWVAGRNTTPAIDDLARGGFRFPAAVAPVPLTLPSHAAILTGHLPRRCGLRDNGQVLGGGPPTLAEQLATRGFATAAFVSGYPLDSIFGLDRGFGLYDDRLPRVAEGELERPADATAAAALEWLRSTPPPWFAWIHFYDPHYPYEPPAGFERPGPRGRYDGEVAFVDRAIGDLRQDVGRLDAGPTLTVFVADHGESLGEHGEGTHGFFIYDSTVLVPLVIHFPGQVAPGTSLAPARLQDVTPTVLDLLGIPAPDGLDGVSLRGALGGRQGGIPPAYVETYQPWLSYGWSPLKAVRHRGWKLIDAPRPELYHLENDPGEARNRLGESPEQERELRELLRRMDTVPAAASTAVADADVQGRLAALGYVAGGSGPEPPSRGLRDPKDARELRDLLTDADQLLRRGDFEAAVSRFDAVLARDATNRFAIHRSGFSLLRLGDLKRAIPRLRKAVQLDPDRAETRASLAEALVRGGQPDAAAKEWAEVVRLQPRNAEAWANMGTAYGRGGRLAEAVEALTHAVGLEPRRPRLLARLAFAEHAAGRIADAAVHLQRTAELEAETFTHSGSLGLLLLQLGRRNEAQTWLARSRPGEGDFAEARLELAILEAERGEAEAARRALAEALAAAPGLRARANADPRLARLTR